MFQYSLVLFTSITIKKFVIFCSVEEKLVKYVGFGRTQRMVILQTCMISHKISGMCGVEWKYFLYIFEEKTYVWRVLHKFNFFSVSPMVKNNLKFGFGRTFFGFGRTRLNSILKCSSYVITLYLDLILSLPHAW